MSTDLTRQISYKEIINWRLHWINCDISFNIIDKIKSAHSLTAEDIQQYVKSVELQAGKVRRIFWEIVTMNQLDESEFDIEKLMATEPKYVLFQKLLEEAVVLLRNRLRNIQENQTHNMFSGGYVNNIGNK